MTQGTLRILFATLVLASVAFDVDAQCSTSPVRASENTTQALLVSVTSLARAKTFLREKNLLGTDSGATVTIHPSRLHGLNISIVERER